MESLKHLIKLPDNQMQCTLCEVVIADTDSIEAHIVSQKHRELYMERLMTRNNIAIRLSEILCYICNKSIAPSKVTSHVQSPEHETKLAFITSIIKSDGDMLEFPKTRRRHSMSSSAHCTICDEDVKFILDSIQNHIASANHKWLRAMVLQPMNGIFPVEGDKYLWCKLCQKFFENYMEVLFDHVEKSDHSATMGKILWVIDGQDIDITRFLENLSNQEQAVCNRCNIQLPCNIDNLRTHILGKKHKDKSSVNGSS